MHVFQKALITLLVAAFLLSGAGANAGEIKAENPILFPTNEQADTAYADNIVNILFTGIDFGTEGHWGSGYKTEIADCHTDAVMVVAINLTQNRIDIVSIPRDSVTIVPGVRGVYKLNSAVNCAATVQEGLERTVAAAEWFLGGVAIDCYFAVDMNTMTALGDAIGGVDFEMDMDYVGSSGHSYVKGWQHLNGTGIMDYVRARTNATVDGNDLGRTRRQREMMTAVFEKLATDHAAITNVLETLTDPDSGFFTDLTGTQAVGLLALAPMLLTLDAEQITSYSLVGKYRTAMKYNFTFTDEENRAAVIEAVYGFTPEPLQYVDYAHTDWLMETGFYSIHVIRVATELKEAVEAMHLTFTEEQQQIWDNFTDAYWNAIDLFQTAADTLDSYAVDRMKSSRTTLRTYGKELAEAVGYGEDLTWSNSVDYWYDDPYINEYQLDWR